LDIKNVKNSKIIISALDWGFGHTTRTSVLIQKLLLQNNQIVFAGNQNQIDFLKKEGLTVRTRYISGYNVKLSSKKSTYLQILKQLPKIRKAINFEQKWLANILDTESFDLIISDNRYGFYSDKTPSVILTHQTEVQLPFAQKQPIF